MIRPQGRVWERGHAMDWERRCMRLCAGVLVFAVVLRLLAAGALLPVGQALRSSEAASVLLYLHTGRVVRLSGPEPTDPPPVSVPQDRAFPRAHRHAQVLHGAGGRQAVMAGFVLGVFFRNLSLGVCLCKWVIVQDILICRECKR